MSDKTKKSTSRKVLVQLSFRHMVPTEASVAEFFNCTDVLMNIGAARDLAKAGYLRYDPTRKRRAKYIADVTLHEAETRTR